MRHRGLILIIDGLGDRPRSELGGATPLEAAHTPVLDELASRGSCGLVDPLDPGIPVDTHTGSGAMMGLTRRTLRELPRGPVEAAGAGLQVRPGDVTMRCNFASVRRDQAGWEVEDRRAGRIAEGAAELAAALDGMDLGQGIEATFRPATGHRAVLRLAGAELSGEISDTDPGDRAQPMRVLPCRAQRAGDGPAALAAEAVNRFLAEAHERLAGHEVNRRRSERGLPPANGILTRGAGRLPRLESWLVRLGLSAAVVAGERTVLGVARMLGLTTVCQPSFTSTVDTDLAGKVAAVLSELERHDMVFLHVKAPDILSHDRDPEGKRDFLSRLDAALPPLLRDDLVVGVAADHSTDSALGVHTGDPVPAILWGPGVRSDGCRAYGEGPCAAGGLGRITATDFFLSVLDLMGVVPTYRSSRWRRGDFED